VRKIICAVIIVASIVFAIPKPMETLNRYNVVLVHGAAPEEKGFESECESGNIYDAYAMMSGHVASPKSIASQLGGAAGMLGEYESEGEKKLTYWLDSAVFEDYQYRNGKVYMLTLGRDGVSAKLPMPLMGVFYCHAALVAASPFFEMFSKVYTLSFNFVRTISYIYIG